MKRRPLAFGEGSSTSSRQLFDRPTYDDRDASVVTQFRDTTNVDTAAIKEVTGESSRSPPAPDKASDPPREKRMRGAESDRELYQLVQQSAAALHSLKKRQSSETVLWAQSVAFRLDSLPPFERAQARVRIEQVLLEAEFPGGRSQEIEESGGRMFLNL
ncbi:hypothetical protein SKAU_G00093790 [Synaphobranchus kaupii]|uniref:Uncharacterized protein n=1 Tax=Synaphobranchus kaupii TaxID=118154 RepID=A0A9Q1FY49_SYNKA|nr:hypothetical protein SKAU_G00093790 [Synaphobranchus kaupii]